MASQVTDISGATAKSDEQPPEKVLRSIENGPNGFASVITVAVGTGESQTSFMVHETVLRENSAFFDKALRGEWKEAADKTFRLPESTSGDFKVFVRFVYTGLLFVEPPIQQRDRRGGPSDLGKWISMPGYRNFFKLADYLQAPDFRDAVLDAIIEEAARMIATNFRYKFPSHMVEDIYSYTVVGAPFRKFMVDSCLRAWRTKDYEQHNFTAYPPDFLADFIQAAGPCITTSSMAGDLPESYDFENSCKYHEHTAQGTPCYREKYRYIMKKTLVTHGQEMQDSSATE